MPNAEKLQKKAAYFERIISLIQAYPRLLIVNADNVGSRQMSQIRFALRGKGVVLMGKNTMIRTALRQNVNEIQQLEKLIPFVKLNIGFVFCIADPSEVREIILKNKVPAPARQGVLAPVDVIIPAGPTGMDLSCVSFFQALGITTKCVKAQVEIQNEVHLIKKNEKVSASAASLLQKLNIRPFSYGLKVENIYDDGSVYSSSVLDMTNDDIINKFKDGILNVAAISREIGIPTQASVPHSILEAFKYCTSLIIESDYTFPEMESMKNFLKNPGAFVAPTVAPTSAAAPATAPAPVEEEEEEDDDMGFGLFD